MNNMAGLNAFGFTPAMRAAAQARGAAQEIPARVTAVHKERYALVTDDQECYGRLKSAVYFNGGTEEFPTTGDFVQILFNEQGDSTITQTLPRKSLFARKNPTLGEGDQTVAANFDSVFIMQSLNHDLNPRRLERYLTLAWQSGAVPVVVLTKADLVESYEEQMNEILRVAAGGGGFARSAEKGQRRLGDQECAMQVHVVMLHFEPAIGGTLGFDGIPIALLARSNPIWTIPAAFLVGILRTGAAGLQFATGIAPEIVDLILAITLLLVSIPVLGRWIFRSRADKVQAAATSWGN